jgi:uncharacterized membrane protein YkvA (DUF1232 family)
MNDNKLSETKIIEEIQEESSKAGPEKLEEVILKEESITRKSKKLNLDRFQKLFNQIKLALEMVRDFKTKMYTEIPWRTMGLITVALLYFLNPLDIVPDLLPVLGLTDDAIAFAAVFKSVQTDLNKYCLWKGYDPDKYF